MNQQRRYIVDILFVLTLFGVFTLSALVLVTVGSDVYKNTVNSMHSNYELRTSTSYITEKIRQNNYVSEQNGGIKAVTLENTTALCLPKTVDQTTYCTYLYCYDGYLKELFINSDISIGGSMLAAGQNIMELSSMEISEEDNGLLSIELIFDDAAAQKIYVNTCSRKGDIDGAF